MRFLHIKRSLILATLALLAVTPLMVIMSNQHVSAVNARDFRADYIIDNAVFTNNESMTASQIQTFLNRKNSVCLKDFKSKSLRDDNGDGAVQDSTTEKYGRQADMSAAQLIKAAADIYRINPKVLLVTLQKEQGLITRTDCPEWRYNTALGYGCPDGSPCDDSAFGFTRQIDYGAYHFRGYMDDSLPSVPYTTGNNDIFWHPSGGNYVNNSGSNDSRAGCGYSIVNIKNRATAALYSYTPYRPNQAALNAGYGTGNDCSSYGNRNFFLYFSDWFGTTYTKINYSSLKTPRWLQLKSDFRKKHLRLGYEVDGVLSQGRQIYFSTKVTIDGQVYLRTKHDTEHGIDKGIPYSQLEEVPASYSSLKQPRWLATKTDLHKVDPVTGEKVQDVVSAGTELFFPTLLEVGGTLYLRTEADTQNGLQTGIPFDLLKEVNISYQGFKMPRWLVATTDTRLFNLKYPSSTTAPIIAASTEQYFDHLVVINGNMYATKGIPANGEYLGVPLDDLRNVQPGDFQSLKYQRAYRMLETARKTDLSTGQPAEEVASGTPVYFQTLTELGGGLYLRSAHDTGLDRMTVIPLTSVAPIEVSFEPMMAPRDLKFRMDIRKVDPVTLQKLDGIISKGRSVDFSQKVSIGGKLYLRTTHDSENGHYKVIPFSALTEDIDFGPMKFPRRLKIATDLRKIDPITLQEIGGVISMGSTADFSQSITINGELYLRSTHDASRDLLKIIPFSKLEEL